MVHLQAIPSHLPDIQMMVYGTYRWAHFNVKLHFFPVWHDFQCVKGLLRGHGIKRPCPYGQLVQSGPCSKFDACISGWGNRIGPACLSVCLSVCSPNSTCVYLSVQKDFWAKGLWITGRGRCINAGAFSWYMQMKVCLFPSLFIILALMQYL